ncbi:hypothetical protein [Kitasatospora sp. NPDC085464]|uniref:hypothetical protein n=1 Tax=Kitasatospora sp. NPDC085464 TaxID=3364063 RepID=UPI0037C6B953
MQLMRHFKQYETVALRTYGEHSRPVVAPGTLGRVVETDTRLGLVAITWTGGIEDVISFNDGDMIRLA